MESDEEPGSMNTERSKRQPAPRILTTTVGSYPYPAWLSAMPTEQSLLDATRVVVDIQRQAGIELPTDGELYRFDVNHPETNGMIEYFITPLAGVLAAQVADLECACVQVDEANLPGNPDDGPLAARAINLLLDAVGSGSGVGAAGAWRPQRAVHLCFGNYGGQTIQKGTWKALIAFLNELHADHLVLELARRPDSDLEALKQVRPEISLGLGVIDVKVNQVETPNEVARRIERAEKALGEGRVGWVHPDCGLWMLHRSVAERKITALVQGRDLYLGR